MELLRTRDGGRQEYTVQRKHITMYVLSMDSIDSVSNITRYLSSTLTSLQVEVESLFPGLVLPDDIYEAGLLLFDRFAVFGPTWPFVVCLREARTRVFMSNAGGLTPMLLLGLEVREEPGVLITKRTVESLAWSGGDSIGCGVSFPNKRRKRIRRILLWILHLRLPHVGKKFHVFGKRRKSKHSRKYEVKA
ncbi:uncharacterized protein [Halyomorpha halys]|uniref:uncharacterized protein n=1 Tax=Halyomorpha halys TaxID=286706 RepID=UPI0006D4DB70|nr:uncharacterized protein LOC106685766 [Halyomorpha halys]